MSNWGGGGWGGWHTGPLVPVCPQGDGSHSVQEAMALNEAADAKRKEGLRIAHERWLAR